MATNAAVLMTLSTTGRWTLTISRTFAMEKFIVNMFMVQPVSSRTKAAALKSLQETPGEVLQD